VIKAALNGGRTRTEHPAIPIRPEELAASAKECVAAGAGAIHFHVRGADGKESLDSDDVGRAVSVVRAGIPGTPVGVSTGAWILRNTALRMEKIGRWAVLPDFASVNFAEDGSVPLAELLLSLHVEVEAGLSDLSGAQRFVESGLAPRCLRLLLEPFETSVSAAMQTLKGIESALGRSGVGLPRVFHGLNATAWDLIDVAAARGYDTRIGFEDILTLPDGSVAPSNGALVAEAARRMLRSPER
jgi:uncharacterized protein (DUF849 family)